MRRAVLVAAAAVGVGVWVVRSRPPKGNVPGGAISSAANTWLNGPAYRHMAEALDLRPEDELLDIGCGEGAFLAKHASHVRYVAGLDHYDLKVRLARSRLADRIAAGTAKVVQGDAGTLPWEDGRFSVVTSMDAFGWFPEPERVLSEAFRVLRPGGRAVMNIGWKLAEGTASHPVLGGLGWIWSEADLRRMLEGAGFEDVSIWYERVPLGLDRLGGGDRVGRLLSDELRYVRAVKRAPVDTAADVAAGVPVAAG